MSRLRLFILTAITLTLTGCNSAPNTPAPAASTQTALQPPAVTTPPDTRPLILCFGDSLTAGYGTDPGQSYPDYLQELISNYRVANAGVSGETTKDGIARLDRIITRNPKIVVLEFGGNDGLRGLPIEQTQANLAIMIQRLQAANITVALAGITLPPDYGPTYIAKFTAMYPALAKRFHTPLLPFLLQGVWNTPGDMQDDHTHATAQGNKQVAINVDKLIAPLLRK